MTATGPAVTAEHNGTTASSGDDGRSCGMGRVREHELWFLAELAADALWEARELAIKVSEFGRVRRLRCDVDHAVEPIDYTGLAGLCEEARRCLMVADNQLRALSNRAAYPDGDEPPY